MQIMTGDKFGIELEEYQGTYSLAATYTGQDGVTRKEWELRQMGEDKYSDKATPVKVRLGDKASAVHALLQIVDHLKDGGDVPF